LRSTGPRVAVLRALGSAASPVTHAVLAEQLADEGMDRATIFRNLTDLVAAGLVRRIDAGDHVWRFEVRRTAAHAQSDHPHFTCVDCGSVSCLQDLTVQIVPVAGAAAKAKVIRFDEVLLKGHCENCS